MKNNKLIKNIIFSVIACIIIFSCNISFAGNLSSDITGIDESRYPGVKSLIQNLQKKHENYEFQIYYTGIDWTEAVTMEYQGHGSSPKNLFSLSEKYKGKWYCPICGSRTYDTGWYCASVEAIEYMMDPRNSLDETSVFQFKNLESADVTPDNIRAVINSKYSSYRYINNDTAINAIVRASVENQLNGYSILAKIINEQGSGTSPLANGQGYNGQYIGYYNLFNVGAYGNGKSTVITNGLKYAYNHGWNSVENSILGGSAYYKSQYIGRGQNTLYYQRFNVISENSLFSHQYQQDIMGAQTSATLLKKYYEASSTIQSVKHTFIIPIYENMPKYACSRPSTSENSELKYEDATVLIDKAIVKASPNTGRIISYLNKNEKVKVLKRATNVSSDGNYWDIIVTNADGTYGYVCRSTISQKITLPKYIFDSKYYSDNNLDIKNVFGYDEDSLINHYITTGIKEGRVSSPTFNVKYYLEQNADLKAAFGNNYEMAYEHFKNIGYKEYRKSSENYEPEFYRFYNKELMQLSSAELMEHYITKGIKEGKRASIDPQIEKIVFDPQIYSIFNPDVVAVLGNDKMALRRHWILSGIDEGRTASLIFDPKCYLQINLDLQTSFGANNYRRGLEHFMLCGITELRTTSLIFSIPKYLNHNEDVRNAFGTNYKLSMIHFIDFGINEGRCASYVFDVKSYLESNLDIKNVYGTNYKLSMIHFLSNGIIEHRKTSNMFDINCYMRTNNDIKMAFGNNYIQYYMHYLSFGIVEGRKCI